MSRAFVREPDGNAAVEELPERAISPHRNLVTAAGLAQIERELRHWRDALADARAADDGAAAARAERELRYWSQRRASAELVPSPLTSDVVRFGAGVRLRAASGEVLTFRIVGEDEADPAQGRISWVSPLARSLIGCEPGDAVEYQGQPAEIFAIE